MKLTLQNIISEDIRDNSKIENAVYKTLSSIIKNKNYEEDDRSYVKWKGIADTISEIMGITYWDVIFFMFKWAMSKGMDPFEEFDMELDTVSSQGESVDFLERIGWWEKNFDILKMANFHDIIINKKGKITLYVDNWEEFAELFEEEQTFERALSEDYEEFFSGWNEHFSTIWEDVDDKNIPRILEALPSYTDKLAPYGVPEVLDEFADEETGVVDVTPRLLSFIKDNDTNNILEELIEENGALSDLKHDIKNAYNVAYNDAAQSELFNIAKTELEELFGGKIDWVKRKGPDDTVYNDLAVTISEENLTENLKKYIDYYSEFPRTNYSSYIGMLTDILNENNDLLGGIDLNYWYPDSGKAQEYFNDALPEYLYMST